jgi:hypothetical protein
VRIDDVKACGGEDVECDKVESKIEDATMPEESSDSSVLE